jgi:hypothetical protein
MEWPGDNKKDSNNHSFFKDMWFFDPYPMWLCDFTRKLTIRTSSDNVDQNNKRKASAILAILAAKR